jgi:hypothetical protein
MPANPNWTRWIRASLGDYLKEVATDLEIPVLIEELDDRTEAFIQSPVHVEIRINGPFTREVSKDYYLIQVDANVLVTNRKDVKNGYIHHPVLGMYHNAMDSVIPMFKYGTGVDDDQSQFGCLTGKSGSNEFVRVLSLGQVEKTDQIVQNMVDARYQMELSYSSES